MDRNAANAKRHTSRVLICLLLLAGFALAQSRRAQGQQASSPQPLNASVSAFSTSFTFSPPICSGCVKTELGFLSLQDGRSAPAILTVAPRWLHGDASVLGNIVDSEVTNGRRATQFGNRLDFALRYKAVEHGGFVFTLAPWGAAYVRGIQGGRAGGAAEPQFTWGQNQLIAEFVLTGAVGVSAGNPRTDYQEGFDYTRSIGGRGYAIFVGALHEVSGGDQTIGTEIGWVIPFRNGQVELASQQLTLNTDPTAQVQARVIVNWGQVFGRRH